MLFLRETGYQLRKKGQTLLTLAVAALLLSCMAFYLGNLRSNEEALANLSNVIEVPVKVCDSTGQSSAGLRIPCQMYDLLSEAAVYDLRCTAQAVAAMGREARAVPPAAGGVDTTVYAANGWEQFSGFRPEKVKFAAGCSETLFSGKEGKAVIMGRFAEQYGLSPGDSFSLPLFLRNRRNNGFIQYEELGEVELQVAGVLEDVTGDAKLDIYVPVGWLRERTEDTGLAFFYDSLSARVEDPLHLNEFKTEMREEGFREAAVGSNTLPGNVLVVSDGLFIRSARELQRNIRTFQGFLIPFFLLVTALVTLSVFLILRGSRRGLALASSLGRSKWKSGLAQLFAVLLLALLSCCAVLPVMCLVGGISLPGAAAICGLFLLCTLLGTLLALFLLLRFDTLSLLTKAD